MITKFKIFENKTEVNIGDYVICVDCSHKYDFKYFFENNVGKIESIGFDTYDNLKYYNVKYEYFPENMLKDIRQYFQTNFDYTMPFSDKELRFATQEEIEDQEIKNTLYKYNL